MAEVRAGQQHPEGFLRDAPQCHGLLKGLLGTNDSLLRLLNLPEALFAGAVSSPVRLDLDHGLQHLLGPPANLQREPSGCVSFQ